MVAQAGYAAQRGPRARENPRWRKYQPQGAIRVWHKASARLVRAERISVGRIDVAKYAEHRCELRAYRRPLTRESARYGEHFPIRDPNRREPVMLCSVTGRMY